MNQALAIQPCAKSKGISCRFFKEDLKNSNTEYKFVASDGTITGIAKAMYYVLSVKVDGDNVSIEMIDSKTGKVWDKATITDQTPKKKNHFNSCTSWRIRE